jgi:hypothetical protein
MRHIRIIGPQESFLKRFCCKFLHCFPLVLLLFVVFLIQGRAEDTQVEAWVVKQKTDPLGPATVWITPDAIKFSANQGDLVLVAHKPTWKVVALNRPENIGFEIGVNDWIGKGLKTYKGRGEISTAAKSTYYDPLLKMNVLQRELPMSGRFFGSNDPALFRSTVKKQLSSMRLRLATNIPLGEEEKKFLNGVYTLPYCGGYPLELATLTTDGGVTYTYVTQSVSKAKVNSSIFDYPTGFKTVQDRFKVFVTEKQKERFTDFLDAFTDRSESEKKKAGATK